MYVCHNKKEIIKHFKNKIMKNLISQLEAGNKVTQAKVFLVLFGTAAAIVTFLELTGLIHIITK